MAQNLFWFTLADRPRHSHYQLDSLPPAFIKYFEISDFAEPITILAPAGDQREIEMRFMPYTDTQLLVIARDITQLRKLEAFTQRLRRQRVS